MTELLFVKNNMDAERKVLISYPGNKGGMNQLFEYLKDEARQRKEVNFSFFSSFDGGKLANFRFLLRLYSFNSLLRENNYDLCHLNVAMRGSTIRSWILAFICRRRATPYIVHLHGSSYDSWYSSLLSWQQKVITAFFNNASKVIVLGRYWEGFVRDIMMVDSRRIVVLPNAVPAPTGIRAKEGGLPRILFLGYVGERKGIVELIEALSSKELNGRAWEAYIAGNGNISNARNRVVSAGLCEKVHFLGWLDQKEVAKLLAECNIFVLPSHAENLPLALLQAMGYALCPISTNVGAIPEVVTHGVDGLIVPVGDAKALLDALITVIDSPDIRCAIGNNAARTYNDKYSFERYFSNLLAVYDEV